ncbi:Asp-tRNA(Asn)/Glu-tRNA(Gln) amidotransferase subunit GatC [Patescibacteria group bacterium]|nr:MAG: Asp-tRNA(Asn)/Glu-tRNA(Gln) amidotransferase subunit GatC [Patescibacteria group bacterium]
MLTIEEVKNIAKLARIELTPAEEKRHAETISAVLDYMKILNEVDTENIEPTSQVTGLSDVTREDAPRDCATKKELLTQMPKVSDNELVVPGVFNGEE